MALEGGSNNQELQTKRLDWEFSITPPVGKLLSSRVVQGVRGNRTHHKLRGLVIATPDLEAESQYSTRPDVIAEAAQAISFVQESRTS